MDRKTRRKVKRIERIVLLSALGAFVVTLIIINFFIPIIYFTAYVHFKKDVYPDGQMRVRYIDVGFGNCSLIELPDGKTMLIDGGIGTYGNVYKLLDVLNKSKISTIDYLICTSVKSEHCGALKEIVKYKSVGTAYVPYATNVYITDEYAAFYNQLLKSGAHVEISENGKGAYNEELGYFFGILSPQPQIYFDSEYNKMNSAPTSENINAASAVVWLEYAGKAFMFLSDTGAEQQQKIATELRLEGNEIRINGKSFSLSRCSVLKSANHCANGFTQPILYDFIQPEAAIISVGNNAKSCPSNTEIAILQLYVNENIYRTDVHGTITVTVNSDECLISKEKS